MAVISVLIGAILFTWLTRPFLLVPYKPLEFMFPNVYLPVQEVTVGIQTDFEDKCRVTQAPQYAAGRGNWPPPYAAAVHL